MRYLLDTNIGVDWLKGDVNVERQAMQLGLKNLGISFITASELYYGAYKSQRVKENLAAVKKISNNLGAIDSSEEICDTFGELKASLEQAGKIIDDADLFIAACALAHDLVLVTNNEKHFKRVKGLKLENWMKITSQ